jgi:flavin-dependent dehydrogenase
VEAAVTPAATLDLEAAAAARWDALVVGAGPAGALAARELARRGHAVLLVDREAFPRWKVCGCCLNGRALHVLAGVGLADLPGRCGAVPLREVRLACRGCRAPLPLPAGVALSRRRLDAALIEAAVGAGAAFLPRTWAMLGDAGTDAQRVVLQQPGRAARPAGARLVLSTEGLGGTLLSRAAGFRVQTTRAARIGAGAVLEEAPDFYEPQVIFMATARGGYVGLVRLEDGRLEVAAALDSRWVRRAGGPGPAAAGLLDQVGWPAVPGLATAGWRGTPRLTRRLRPLAAGRLLALGDAAGYVEPFTGEGIAWALAAAVALAPLASQALREPGTDLAAEWPRLYRQAVGRRQVVCRWAARLLRRPLLTGAAVRLLARLPGLAAPVIRYLNAAPAAESSPR